MDRNSLYFVGDFDTDRSHPARGAWIEISANALLGFGLKSHPARGAWIEIYYSQAIGQPQDVAPR